MKPAALAFKKTRKEWARVKNVRPVRDERYLEWIRSLRCCVPGCISEHSPGTYGCVTEAAHVGERGLRQKCSDYEALPICAWHHRLSRDSHHVAGKRFWELHGIDREILIGAYNASFEEMKDGEA